MFTQVYVCYVFRHSVMFDSFATPWTVIHQAPQSMEFFRQKCWSGLPFLPSEDLPDTGIELGLLCLLHWQVDSYQCTIWKAHTQVYAYFRIHLIINTKYVQFLIYQLCLNKAVKKKKLTLKIIQILSKVMEQRLKARQTGSWVWFVPSLLCSLHRSTLSCGFIFSSYLTLWSHTHFHPIF